MSQYTAPIVKRNGPQYIKNNVTDVYLCIAPLVTDTVSQIAAKAIATTTYAGTDVSLADSGNDLQVTLNGKSGIDPSGTAADTDDIVVVYCSATENLLGVDANDRVLTNETGDTIDIPAAQYFVRALSAVA